MSLGLKSIVSGTLDDVFVFGAIVGVLSLGVARRAPRGARNDCDQAFSGCRSSP